MDGLALDPTQIDWHGRDGLRYRFVWKTKWRLLGLVLASVGVAIPQTQVPHFKPRYRSLRDVIVFASGKSNYYISKVVNWFWNATAFTPPTTLQFALWTASLTAASTGATAGEASYTGYTRVAVTANTTNFPTSSGGAAINNATAITFASNAGTLQTATFVAVLDSATVGAGNILYWGSITSTAVNPGDTPQINTSALTASEA